MNKKILMLLHLPPPVHGSSIMGKTIKSSKLLNNSFTTHYINLLGSKSINETGKFKFHKVTQFLKVYILLLKNLIFFRPNICYFALSTTGIAFIKDLILVTLIKLFNVKIVYHLHNKGIKAQSKNSIFNRLYQFAFKNTDVIILSEKLYYDIENYFQKDMVHICFNGIEDLNIYKAEKTSKPLPTILFLSNLLSTKGILDLIDALSLLNLRNVPFECRIIGGEGDISAQMLNTKIYELGLSSCVQYLGKQYGEEKIQAYLESDIFVLPTYYSNECFPLVLLEAMSFSLPIISTKEGGIEDIVLDEINGYLIDKNDVELLAENLEKLLYDNQLRISMGIQSRILFENKFTLEAFDSRLFTILNTVD